MLVKLRHILEMIRFSHTVFALPFALWSAVMAWQAPAEPPVVFRVRDLLGVVLCMVLGRSCAMAFNRLADADVDARNPRTARRHLPAGLLTRSSVRLFTTACAAGFVGATSLFWPNPLPIVLSLPVLVFLCGYSYAKRFTSLAHFWLGTALMLAPVCAWIAIRGQAVVADPRDVLPAVWLGLAVLMWVAGFDIIYACQDVDFDVKTQLRSIPARWGVASALRLSAVCHLAMVGLLASLPFLHHAGAPRIALDGLYLLGVAG
ncbi:MAG: UbiA-like polyprenyltransferase, partial [Pirellulaceae bacterium]